MDPITAVQTVDSLISLIKFCCDIWQTIQEFRHGDESLAELYRDTETFIEFLKGFKRVLMHLRLNHNIRLNVLKSALQDALNTVRRFETRMNSIKNTKITVTRRLKWLKSRAEFQKFRDGIMKHDIKLNAILSSIIA
jgi:hypothetical protein